MLVQSDLCDSAAPSLQRLHCILSKLDRTSQSQCLPFCYVLLFLNATARCAVSMATSIPHSPLNELHP